MKLTQSELAEKAGVGLRFIREMEQGKETLRLDKVNQVLQLFGYEVGGVPRPSAIYKTSSIRGFYRNFIRSVGILLKAIINDEGR